MAIDFPEASQLELASWSMILQVPQPNVKNRVSISIWQNISLFSSLKKKTLRSSVLNFASFESLGKIYISVTSTVTI